MVLSKSASPAGSSTPGSYPPLPDSLPAPPRKNPSAPPPLADGCYLLEYASAGDGTIGYVGTLRVETKTGQLIASGDLYQRDGAAGQPDPACGIPIFPVSAYRHYLRLIRLFEIEGGFDLVFELHPLKRETVVGRSGETVITAAFTAPVVALTARIAPLSPGNRFAGDVTGSDGAAAGTLSLTWVSPYLRRAAIEMDRVPGRELPLDNGEGESWRTIFDKVGWDITLRTSDSNIEEPGGGFWSGAEAHATMLARRDIPSLDKEWRYYLLAVRKIVALLPSTDPAIGERGYMFDEKAADTDKLPREGLVVAADWPIPSEPMWGLVQGKRAADTVTYFRTAVHEFGHAMGLVHNQIDNGFMNPTDGVARRSLTTPDTPFPKNMRWAYHPDDEMRLRHWPDTAVRPAGIGLFGENSPMAAVKSGQHRLEVTAETASVPLGAPVRVNLTLTNIADDAVLAPDNLSLKSEFVRGQVVDPAGTVRTFAPLVISEFQEPLPLLDPGQSFTGSLTLLRGGEGELFPLPGDYRIAVEVTWDSGASDIFAGGELRVTVTAVADAAHAEAAQKVLSTPEMLLVVALGGDHLKEGSEAIGAALGNKILRPHFAYLEAKRLAAGFFKRAPDLQAVAGLIDETTVLSPAEFSKLVRIVKDNAGSAGAQALATTLKARAAKQGASEEVKALAQGI